MRYHPERKPLDRWVAWDEDDGEIDIDYDATQDDQQKEKPKRKFKHGDYRLTFVGIRLIVGGVAFSISLAIFLGIIFLFGDEYESNFILIFFWLQAILSMIGTAIMMASDTGRIERIFRQPIIAALVFIVPALIIGSVIGIVGSIIDVSFETVGEQSPPRRGGSRPPSPPTKATYDDLPEPVPPPEPPGWT